MTAASQLAGPQRGRRHIPIRRKLAYSGVIVLLLVLLAEGAGQVMLRARYGGRLPERERLHEYHPELGWVNRKSRRVPHRYGENNHATHNSQGFRGEADYTPEVPPGRYRTVCLGDSFTYGVDVDDKDTFPAQMESHCPAVEAVNMGVAGYGLDQMYLWYMKEGTRLKADLVLLAFIEDDIHRMKMNAFMTKNPKPQLVLDGEALKPVNVPVPTWGDAADTGWLEEFPNRTALVQITRKVCNTYLNGYEIFPVAERVFEVLKDYSRKNNQKLVLVYLPSRVDLDNDQPTDVAQEVQQMAERKQIPFFNLTGTFRAGSAEGAAPLFVSDGRHYSKQGYCLVAETLLERLRQEFPDFPR